MMTLITTILNVAMRSICCILFAVYVVEFVRALADADEEQENA